MPQVFASEVGTKPRVWTRMMSVASLASQYGDSGNSGKVGSKLRKALVVVQ